jgi:hypothetical protein
MRDRYPICDYIVLVSRAQCRPVTDAWPIRLKDRLPPIPIPLLEGDPDVILDLQQAVTEVCSLGCFDSVIDYRKAPDVPLTPDQAAWADRLLREKGLRP